MNAWMRALGKALWSGSVASVASTAVLSLRGRKEQDAAVVPTNTTSHWLWDERAMHRRDVSVKYSVVGYAIHHVSSVFWATFYERWGEWRPPRGAAETLGRGMQIAAAAAFVDFVLTPRRLTPGFERRLSMRSLCMVYLSFGAGLAAATLMERACAKRPEGVAAHGAEEAKHERTGTA